MACLEISVFGDTAVVAFFTDFVVSSWSRLIVQCAIVFFIVFCAKFGRCMCVYLHLLHPFCQMSFMTAFAMFVLVVRFQAVSFSNWCALRASNVDVLIVDSLLKRM